MGQAPGLSQAQGTTLVETKVHRGCPFSPRGAGSCTHAACPRASPGSSAGLPSTLTTRPQRWVKPVMAACRGLPPWAGLGGCPFRHHVPAQADHSRPPGLGFCICKVGPQTCPPE